MGVGRLKIISRGRLRLPFKLHTELSKVDLLYLSPTDPQSISTFSLQGKRSGGPGPELLLATVKNRQLRICSSWNIKLHPIVRLRVYDHASVSNFCIIFVLLVCMYCEDRSPEE